MKLEAILFDFDGVIGVTGDDTYSAWHKTLLPFGVNLDREEYFLAEGRSSEEQLDILAKKYNLPKSDFSKILESKDRIYKENNSFRIYEGVLDLLSWARSNEIKTAIVSGGSKKRLQGPEYLAITSRFDLIITAQDTDARKPSPEPYLLAAKRLNINTTNCVVIENAPLGIESATAANIKCIAVSTTLRPALLSQANYVVKDLVAAKKILENIY
ncbi:MAG: HAD family phosphatase [bacterium]|nr:HAD family phosphatase [bacterium]